MEPIKVGDRIEIFQQPLTRTNPEGWATVIAINSTPGMIDRASGPMRDPASAFPWYDLTVRFDCDDPTQIVDRRWVPEAML